MNAFILTQGCSANRSDSEVMAGILVEDGHHIADSPEKADILILNTCTVKSPTEMKAFSLLKKWRSMWPGKKVIVTGCIAQSSPEKLDGYSLVGTRQIHRITDAVAAAARGKVVRFLDSGPHRRLLLPHVRKNPVVEIIPISAGCLGSCSFCKTKQARGALLSYPLHDIVKQAGLAVKDGAREIWLTSQDTGAYGKDIRTDLPALIDAVVAVPGDFKIRVGMMNPDHALLFLPRLVKAMKHPKVFRFLHVPVQAGSDLVLQAMRRSYGRKDFEKVVAYAREELPDITIATDIIVGFPGETEADFQETVDVLERLRIPVVNLSKFYPRQGTIASRMKKVPTSIVKRRSEEISALQKRTVTNKEWVGWVGPVLIDEPGKRALGEDSSIGRNDSYRQVIVPRIHPLGRVVLVKVVAVTPIDLRACLI